MKRALAVVVIAFTVSSARAVATCDAPEYRQFDFWIGEWVVTVPGGREVGVNRISREYQGCVVHERYTANGGFAGESLNTWDAARRLWHQTWVDNTGTLLLLEGGVVGGAMVLEGAGVNDGMPVRHRITWRGNTDGSVRQLWETAGADGAWKTVFDGLYRPRH